ncbi:4596_t:CDS:1, partial [Acaulospora morrowiae]
LKINSIRANSSSKCIEREEVHIDTGDHVCWFERACGECTHKFFQEQPSNWTSGNSEIDKIIREFQESGRDVDDSLE